MDTWLNRLIANYFRLLLILVLVCGVLLLLAANCIRASDSLLHHALRDVGIAFIIAFLVTVVLEHYSHRQREADIRSGLLDVILGKVIPPDLWAELKASVIAEGILCDSWELRVVIHQESLQIEGQPAQPRFVARSTMTYTLRSQINRDYPVELKHELEAEEIGQRNNGEMIPRLVSLACQAASSVDHFPELNLDAQQLEAYLDANRSLIKIPLTIPAAPSQGVRVVLEREELATIPGQFSWYVFWITRNPTVSVDTSQISGHDFRVYARHPNRGRLRQIGSGIWRFEGIMLPGQGFAIVFRTKRTSPPPQPAVVPHSDP